MESRELSYYSDFISNSLWSILLIGAVFGATTFFLFCKIRNLETLTSNLRDSKSVTVPHCAVGVTVVDDDSVLVLDPTIMSSGSG